MTEITDPATELWQMFSSMRGLQYQGKTRDALALHFSCQTDDGTYFTILNAVISRCDRLCQMVETEGDLAEHRAEVLDAIRTMRRVFGTDRFYSNWAEWRDSLLQNHHLTAVKMAAISIRRSHPLRKLTSEESADLLAKIDDLIQEAQRDQSLSARIIENAFNGLKVVVERLTFFGHDVLIERLFLVNAEIKTAASRSSNEDNAGLAKLLKNGTMVISLAVNLLVASDAVPTAVENHYHRAQALLEHLSAEVPAQEMKRLPPPKRSEELKGA